MKSRVLLILLAMVMVVCLVVFGACKAEEAPGVVEEEGQALVEKGGVEDTTPEKPPFQWPDNITILSYSTGSIDYAVGVAWSTIMASETGIKIRLVAEDSDYLRSLWVSQGRFDMGIGVGARMDLENAEQFATRVMGPYHFRILWPIFLSEQGFTVRGDSGIDTPYDLKGKKVADLAFAGAFGRQVMTALLAWGNLTPEDVTWVPIPSNDVLSRSIIDGKVDVGVGDVSSPRWYEAAAAPHGISIINLNPLEDPGGARRFLKVLDRFQFAKINSGVPDIRGRWGLISFLAYGCSAGHMSEDFAYHFVKWMNENYDLYKDKHFLLGNMKPEGVISIHETQATPVHEGVIKYLKEIGLWTDEHQARQQKKLDLNKRYIDAYAAALTIADEKGIEVNPANEEWIQLWKDYIKELGIPPQSSLMILPEQP